MCLGVPGKIVSVDGLVAIVDFWGVQKEVQLHIVDEPVSAGDYILNHVGYAIRKIPASEIEATLELYDELIRAASEEDLMAMDVRGEVAAATPSGDRESGGAS